MYMHIRIIAVDLFIKRRDFEGDIYCDDLPENYGNILRAVIVRISRKYSMCTLYVILCRDSQSLQNLVQCSHFSKILYNQPVLI